jgi:acetolactate synthase-1/2/3 large subunit
MEVRAHAVVRVRNVIVGTPVLPPPRGLGDDFLAPSASTHDGHCIVLEVNEPRHGGHLLAAALTAEGVQDLFTLSGGHLAPVYDGCLAEGIRIVDFRHEQAAVHAADGWARVTGAPGVAAVTAGPGVTGSVTAIANAFQADSPVLVIGGKSPLAELGMGSFQEMDQVTLVGSVSKWARTCWETRRIADIVAEAFRHATSGRQGPVFVDVPVDVLAADWPPGVDVSDGSRTDAGPLADPDQVTRAVRVIGEAEHLVILAGSGVRWSGAHGALAALAGALKVPVFLNSLGRGCLPPSHPSFFSAARGYALGKADVILALGIDWDFRLGFGRRAFSPSVRVIQVDEDATQIGRNREVELGLVGDPKQVIGQILAAGVGTVAEPSWTGEVRDEEDRLIAEAYAGMHSDAVPIHPLRLVREVRDFLDSDAIVVGDGGDIVGIGASVIQPQQPGHWLDPGPFGCLGVGSPFAIAAKLAKPDAQVLVLYGDGSFGLSAMEYESAIRQRIPFVGVIGNDGAWGQIKLAQETLYGEGKAPGALLSQETGYDRMVEALGGYGERVTEPGEIRVALDRAFDSEVPACINVILDPTLMKRSSYLG